MRFCSDGPGNSLPVETRVRTFVPSIGYGPISLRIQFVVGINYIVMSLIKGMDNSPRRNYNCDGHHTVKAEAGVLPEERSDAGAEAGNPAEISQRRAG